MSFKMADYGEKDPKSCTKNEKNSTPDYKEKFTKCKKDLDGANEKIAKLNKDLELNQFELWSIKKNFNYEEVRKELPQFMDTDGIFAETQARLENEVATLRREIVTYKSQQGIQTDGKAKDKLDEDEGKLEKEVLELKKKIKELEDKNKVLQDENRAGKKQTVLSDGKDTEELRKDKEELEKARRTIENHDKNIVELETRIKALCDENKVLKDRSEGKPDSKLEKVNKQLTEDLRAAKDQGSKLEKENEHLNEKLSAAKDKGSNLEKENEQLKVKLLATKDQGNTSKSDSKTELDELNRDVEKLQKELEEQKQTIQKLKDAQKKSVNAREMELMEEVESLKKRLSKMTGVQLMDGNPNIADLSDTNRPTKLAERYSELYDFEWTNAYEILEEKGKSELQIIETLRSILMDTYKFCVEVSQEQMRQTKHALAAVTKKGEEIPDENIPVVKRRQPHDLSKVYSPDLIDSIFESYKEKRSPKDIGNKHMKSYVHKCITLCWLMNVQDPPVVLDTRNHSGPFNGDVFRTYTKIGNTLDFVVWPALYIQQGGAMLAKGVAQGK